METCDGIVSCQGHVRIIVILKGFVNGFMKLVQGISLLLSVRYIKLIQTLRPFDGAHHVDGLGRNFKLLLLLVYLLAEVAIDVFKVVGISKSFICIFSLFGVILFLELL